MVNKNNIKSGFSLAEALISMLLLSIFFVATSKVITTKPKSVVQGKVHGYYECYMKGDALYQKSSDSEEQAASENVCKYTLPGNISSGVIYYLNSTGFYLSKEEQLTGNDSEQSNLVTITKESLEKYNEIMDYTGEPNNNLDELKTFFELSYPTSNIYQYLQVGGYSGPAVFIGW